MGFVYNLRLLLCYLPHPPPHPPPPPSFPTSSLNFTSPSYAPPLPPLRARPCSPPPPHATATPTCIHGSEINALASDADASVQGLGFRV